MSRSIFQELTGIRPNLLGRRFRLGDDPTIYTVRGQKGKSGDILLEASHSEEYRTVSKEEFQRLAIRSDE